MPRPPALGGTSLLVPPPAVGWVDAHAMTGWGGLNNLEAAILDIFRNNVLGDFIETGAFRGGATILMRAMQVVFKEDRRRTFVADSFEGIPKVDLQKFPEDKVHEAAGGSLNRSGLFEQVKDTFYQYNLMDDGVVFLKGWFKDTLPRAPITKLALIRMDGDLYQSTWEALESLYPKLSVGGYVIVDDW